MEYKRYVRDINSQRFKKNKRFISWLISLVFVFYFMIFYYRIKFINTEISYNDDLYNFPLKDIPDNIYTERLQRILIKNNANKSSVINKLTELTFKEYIKHIPSVNNERQVKETIQKRIELITKRHDKPYFYIHFAKTGGTSFINSVKTKYDNVCHFWNDPNIYTFHQCMYEPNKTIDFVMGHVYFGLYKAIPIGNNDVFYFSVFRNPIYRVLSHYKYHKTQLRDPNHLHASNRTLTEWVKDVEFANNHMTLYLSGMVKSAWWNNDLDNLITFRPEGNDRLTKDFDITEKIYKEALYNLNNYVALVGLQERPNETISHFSYFLNSLFEQEYLNVSNDYRKELTEKEVDMIKKKNKYDLLLYEYVFDYFIIQRSFIDVLKYKVFKDY